jgi:hypothetical protein
MRPPCCQGSGSTYVYAGSAAVCQRKPLISLELGTPIRADTIVADILDRIIRSLDVFEHHFLVRRFKAIPLAGSDPPPK